MTCPKLPRDLVAELGRDSRVPDSSVLTQPWPTANSFHFSLVMQPSLGSEERGVNEIAITFSRKKAGKRLLLEK